MFASSLASPHDCSELAAAGPPGDTARAPRWLVTNGDTTIGPVHTELLLRGYLGGRIPLHCRVREVGWGSWRPLERIREIGSLNRSLLPDAAPSNLREATERLPTTRDVGGMLSSALGLAAQVLDASAGLVHRYRSPLALLVTSTVVGVPAERLGEVLPSSDPAYCLALRGKGLFGSPHQGLAERIVAERLQFEAPLSSVVMAPVIVGGRLVALLELGRTEHVFRADDADDLAEFAARVARRIG